jgi:hypothetical protein
VGDFIASRSCQDTAREAAASARATSAAEAGRLGAVGGAVSTSPIDTASSMVSSTISTPG